MSSNGSSNQDTDPISETVRQAYEDILNEALPERFVVLLKKLRQGEIPDQDVTTDDAS